MTVRLTPENAPVLEAECALRDTPDEGAVVGVRFDAAETVVLAGDRHYRTAPRQPLTGVTGQDAASRAS